MQFLTHNELYYTQEFLIWNSFLLLDMIKYNIIIILKSVIIFVTINKIQCSITLFIKQLIYLLSPYQMLIV